MFKDIMLSRSNYVICLPGQPLTNSRSGQNPYEITDNNNTIQCIRLYLASPHMLHNVTITHCRKRSIMYDPRCS